MSHSATRDCLDIRAAAAHEPACYTCPGESKPITRAVHFSRLAAYYGACRSCQHRHDTGALPRQIVERIDRVASRTAPPNHLTPFGLRGVYLNQISRTTAQDYAAAFAHVIQRTCGEAGRSSRWAPTIVVGQDARHSSPDITIGVAAGLRRRGCHVVDVGVVSLPCIRFTVDHLQASGAVYVSGYGYGPAHTGFDFLGPNATPWSTPGQLDDLITCAETRPPRTTRHGGRQRSFAADVPYAAGLRKYFHALRRLRIAVCSSLPPVHGLLHQLFDDLPCQLHWVMSPRGADVERVKIEAVEALRTTIAQASCHAGLLIHDDAQTCEFFDESGSELPLRAMGPAMIDAVKSDHAHVVCLLDTVSQQACGPLPAGTVSEATDAAPEGFAGRFQEVSAHIGIDARGRFWFNDAYPVCDAVVTLAKFLQLLSRSDAPASALGQT